MASAREYFEKNINLEFGVDYTIKNAELEIVSTIRSVQDYDAGSKYLKIYIPDTEFPDHVLTILLSKIEDFRQKEGEIKIKMGIVGCEEKIDSKNLRFTGRILVWTPSVIDKLRWNHMSQQLERLGMSLLVRDGTYVKLRDKYDLPAAFISHDSRDKHGFVRGLALKLQSMLCPVWYDEFTLKPGDSLRDNIESGLKSCPKCIVILSKNFFSNPGWGKREFDMIYSREIIEGRRLMVPIWLGVTKKEVFDYSPILLDTLGIPADLGTQEVARRLFMVLDYQAPLI